MYFVEEDSGCRYPSEEEDLEAMLLGLSHLIGLLHIEKAGGAREPLSRLIAIADEPVDLGDGIGNMSHFRFVLLGMVVFLNRGCACHPKSAS